MTKEERVELEACPFCGGAPELDAHRGYAQFPSGKRGVGVAISCSECHADMMLCREDMPELYTDDLVRMLKEAWNRRSPDPERIREEAIEEAAKKLEAEPEYSRFVRDGYAEEAAAIVRSLLTTKPEVKK